jgi:hypothetical protein
MHEVIDTLDLEGGLQRALEDSGEAGAAEVCDLLGELLDEGGPAGAISGLSRLKRRVFRAEMRSGSRRSVILKCLAPAVAQRNQLIAERWLPALGLSDGCAALLGVAADRHGTCVWHVYQDLGIETLAARCDAERVRTTVDLVAELHTRGANHPIVPEVRRHVGHLGVQYFVANIADAITALQALAEADIAAPLEFEGVADRLLARLVVLRDDTPRRTAAFETAGGPDTLLHGDLWTINAFVSETSEGLRARLIDWDRAGVGPFSYDLSTFLFRFPLVDRPAILALYREAVARAGWRLAGADELQLLFDTAERARYANRVIWPALALVDQHAAWGFPELAEVERWFQDLDAISPITIG